VGSPLNSPTCLPQRDQTADKAGVSLTDQLRDGTAGAENTEVEVQASVDLNDRISKVQEPSAHCVQFGIGQFSHRDCVEFTHGTSSINGLSR
jgi:hypothetical protein